MENKNFELNISYLDLNLARTRSYGAAMLKNLRKKPDLTFVKIAHTGITLVEHGGNKPTITNLEKIIICSLLKW